MNYYSTENQENHQQAMDYSAYYQQQQSYDPSSQLYQHPANNYDYSYSYHHQGYNPQPIPNNTAAAAARPQQHEEQEPNPPGVPASVQAQKSYYQYPLTVAPAAVLNAGLHYQPIVHPQEIPQVQAHSGPRPNAFNNRTFRGRGRGRGSGSVRGRGRGRGRALSLHRSAQDQTIHPEARVQGWAPQPMPQYPAPPVPPKVVRCEICQIECDTNEILEQHNNGKKHQKNLKKITSGGQMVVGLNSNVASEIPFQPVQVEENLTFQGQSRSPPVHSRAVPCELCKVVCNTAEIFEKHRNGKKHQKNLKAKSVTSFVQVAQTSIPAVPTSEVPSQPEKIDGPGDPQSKEETLSLETNKEENKVEAEKQKVEEMGPTEEESAEGRGSGFKRKMRGGKGGRRVKMKPFNGSKRPMDPPRPKEAIPLICELCNVKCESQVVYQSHLVGKKHQLKAKRFLTPHEILGQEILAALTPALQALLQQNAIASTSMGPPLLNQCFGPFGPLPFGPPQNFMEASVSGANMENPTMENLGQLQTLSADNMSQQLVSAEGKSSEGKLESQTEHIANGPANGVEQNVGLEPLPGSDAKTEQDPTKGGDSAQ